MAEHARLRHNALLYDSEDEYLERAVPFLRDGLAAGEGAIVANTRAGIAAIRDALGEDGERVRFVDVGASYTRPAHALAAYHRVYAEQLAQTPRLRAVADVQSGPEPAEWDLWTGYEAVFNLSFAHLPAWVLCSYDTGELPDRVLEGVVRTHPELVDAAGWRDSELFAEPAALLAGLAPAGEPSLAGLRPLAFGADLESFREALARELVAARLPEQRAMAMLLAAGEVADNARRHGGGIESARAGLAAGRFVCEVVDRGPGFDDPAAGFLAPRPGRGTGLWVARQLVWDIRFSPTEAGFSARVWV